MRRTTRLLVTIATVLTLMTGFLVRGSNVPAVAAASIINAQTPPHGFNAIEGIPVSGNTGAIFTVVGPPPDPSTMKCHD